MHVHNLDLKLSTLILFIETTLIGREFHILMTDGKNEWYLKPWVYSQLNRLPHLQGGVVEFNIGKVLVCHHDT